METLRSASRVYLAACSAERNCCTCSLVVISSICTARFSLISRNWALHSATKDSRACCSCCCSARVCFTWSIISLMVRSSSSARLQTTSSKALTLAAMSSHCVDAQCTRGKSLASSPSSRGSTKMFPISSIRSCKRDSSLWTPPGEQTSTASSTRLRSSSTAPASRRKDSIPRRMAFTDCSVEACAFCTEANSVQSASRCCCIALCRLSCSVATTSRVCIAAWTSQQRADRELRWSSTAACFSSNRRLSSSIACLSSPRTEVALAMP
mmetsp:Transcript_32386/g.86885  ORF Transcript_32386/g.86885 Transcript_32386/m.86885 type:complete len:267 (-) Transcript_32386:295-1095(-)